MKTKALFLFLIAATIISFVANRAEAAPDFVGRKHDGNLKEPSCEMQPPFGKIEGTKLEVSYGDCKGAQIILLSKPSDGGADNQQIVVNQVNVRPLKKGETFHTNGPYCYFNNNREKIITFPAIFKGWNATKPMNKKNGFIVEGWLVNPKTEKIEKAGPEILGKISCEDESGGES